MDKIGTVHPHKTKTIKCIAIARKCVKRNHKTVDSILTRQVLPTLVELVKEPF